MIKINTLLCSLMLVGSVASADLLIGWDVAGLNGTNNNVAAAFLAADIDSGNIVRGPGINGSAVTNSITAVSWTLAAGSSVANAIASNDYFSITMAADVGFTLNITNFSWRSQRSATGPGEFTLRSSVDSFASDLAFWDVGASTSAQDLQTTLALAGANTIEFRIYGHDATASTGTGRIQNGADIGATGIDLGVFGTVVPEPGTLALMTTGLLALTASRRKIRRAA